MRSSSIYSGPSRTDISRLRAPLASHSFEKVLVDATPAPRPPPGDASGIWHRFASLAKKTWSRNIINRGPATSLDRHLRLFSISSRDRCHVFRSDLLLPSPRRTPIIAHSCTTYHFVATTITTEPWPALRQSRRPACLNDP